MDILSPCFHVDDGCILVPCFFLFIFIYFFIAWQLFVCMSYILVKSTSYFFSLNFLPIFLPWFPPDFMRYFSLYFENLLSSLSVLCAWTEGDLNSDWVIHITLFLTRLWDCCGIRGKKHLRARGSEWMSVVKQSLKDMNSWWLWRQSQDLNKINPNVDGR